MSDNQKQVENDMQNLDNAQDRTFSVNPVQEPLPELRPGDYQDGYWPGEEKFYNEQKEKYQKEPTSEKRFDEYIHEYLPGEENFGQRKNPIGTGKEKQVAEARYANSGTAFG